MKKHVWKNTNKHYAIERALKDIFSKQERVIDRTPKKWKGAKEAMQDLLRAWP